MSLELVVSVVPTLSFPQFWIIVHKKGRVPFAIQSFGSTMEAFAALVEQNVSGRQDNLMSPSMKVLNH
jgi:hypothetical protein